MPPKPNGSKGARVAGPRTPSPEECCRLRDWWRGPLPFRMFKLLLTLFFIGLVLPMALLYFPARLKLAGVWWAALPGCWPYRWTVTGLFAQELVYLLGLILVCAYAAYLTWLYVRRLIIFCTLLTRLDVMLWVYAKPRSFVIALADCILHLACCVGALLLWRFAHYLGADAEHLCLELRDLFGRKRTTLWLLLSALFLEFLIAFPLPVYGLVQAVLALVALCDCFAAPFGTDVIHLYARFARFRRQWYLTERPYWDEGCAVSSTVAFAKLRSAFVTIASVTTAAAWLVPAFPALMWYYLLFAMWAAWRVVSLAVLIDLLPIDEYRYECYPPLILYTDIV